MLTTMSTPSSSSSELKQEFTTKGYVIVPSLISPTQFPLLKQAAEDVINKTRSGAWLSRRTVGRQFPPFDEEGPLDAWGVQHIMHPDLGESGKVFGEWYTSDGLVGVARELLGCGEGELQMGEYAGYLITPECRFDN